MLSTLMGSSGSPVCELLMWAASDGAESVQPFGTVALGCLTACAVIAAAKAEKTPTQHEPTAAVVVVDPVSTGANVADAFLRGGFGVIAITSGQVQQDLPVDPTLRSDYLAQLRHDSAEPEQTLSRLRSLPVTIVGVVSGSELGIEATDYVSTHLGLPSNGVSSSDARRDKFRMQETVRAAGLRAVNQARVSTWETALQFATNAFYPLVLKPVSSAGSDHIFKVADEAEMRIAFDAILNSPNAFGVLNNAVLLQEFMAGTEYIVDTCSRDGVHKIVAVWKYDKRDHAGHAFVYFGMESVSTSTDECRSLCEYTLRVLDALGIRHGAGHAEVILTRDGPCLVEVGARPQGCEGTFMPLADRVWGYNQVSVLVAATVSPHEWEALPLICGPEREAAFKVDFVCSISGILERVAHLDTIRSLASFLSLDLLPESGARMSVTIDCFTGCGSVSLVHHDRAQLMADVEAVRQLEKTMWIMAQD